MASLSTCHLGLLLGWQILLNLVKSVLLKSCLDTLLKPITDIINATLCSGLFPDDFKHAHVNPLLKTTYLSKENLNSYMFPISALFPKY